MRDIFAMLTSRDLEASVGFYRDLLGGEVTYRFPESAPEFVTLRIGPGQVGIGLDPQLNTVTPDAPFALCVVTDDCDAAVEHLRAHGVTVVTGPSDQPWGERMAVVADPDGYRVVLTSPQ